MPQAELQPDDHPLEIGSGWGGFALYVAQRYGCRVTTTTISRDWMAALWMAFATTFNISLHWLKPCLGLAALLGMIAEPLVYYGGVKLGGVTFSEPLAGLIGAAGVWTLAMPLLLMLAARWDGMAEPKLCGLAGNVVGNLPHCYRFCLARANYRTCDLSRLLYH